MSESINRGQTPEQLKFFCGGENEDFLVKLKLLGLTQENKRFAEFLTIDYCACIMRERKLTSHVYTGNIYYDDFNTNESFYNFLLVQQDNNKKILNLKFSFGENFQQCIENYLAGIRATRP